MLAEKLKKHHIILASGSPRRQQFLKDLDIDFEIRLKEVDEVYDKSLKGSEITDFLAELKAKPFKTELKDNDILITSDTIVWFNDEALGKPKNYDEAFKMIKSLSGKSHEVISSICITSKAFQKTINDSTEVVFNNLTDEEINYYIENYKPYDKAGAYGIQEWIGKVAVKELNGSYFNVMGMPVHKLYKELNKL